MEYNKDLLLKKDVTQPTCCSTIRYPQTCLFSSCQPRMTHNTLMGQHRRIQSSLPSSVDSITDKLGDNKSQQQTIHHDRNDKSQKFIPLIHRGLCRNNTFHLHSMNRPNLLQFETRYHDTNETKSQGNSTVKMQEWNTLQPSMYCSQPEMSSYSQGTPLLNVLNTHVPNNYDSFHKLELQEKIDQKKKDHVISSSIKNVVTSSQLIPSTIQQNHSQNHSSVSLDRLNREKITIHSESETDSSVLHLLDHFKAKKNRLEALQNTYQALTCAIVDLLASPKAQLYVEPSIFEISRNILLHSHHEELVVLAMNIPRYLESSMILAQSNQQSLVNKEPYTLLTSHNLSTNLYKDLYETTGQHTNDSNKRLSSCMNTQHTTNEILSENDSLSNSEGNNDITELEQPTVWCNNEEYISGQKGKESCEEHYAASSLHTSDLSVSSFDSSKGSVKSNEKLHNGPASSRMKVNINSNNSFLSQQCYPMVDNNDLIFGSIKNNTSSSDDNEEEMFVSKSSIFRKPPIPKKKPSTKPACIPMFHNVEAIGTSGWLAGEKTAGEFIPQETTLI